MKSEPIKIQRARKRLHDLIVKHALSRATPAEEAKMRRYQALFRYHPRPGEQHAVEVSSYRIRTDMKKLAGFIWRHEHPILPRAKEL